jgi:hypothetical protein
MSQQSQQSETTRAVSAAMVALYQTFTSESGAYLYLNGKRLTCDHGTLEVWQGTTQVYMGHDWYEATEALRADTDL